MKFPIYLILIFILVSSCETTLNVPLPDHEEKLVVNAILEAGEQFDVYLTRSYGPLEEVTPKDILIGDATVEILNDGNVIETLTYKDTIISGPFEEFTGKYFSANNNVEIGKTYSVRVTHPDYPQAMGITSIPEPIEITGGSMEQNVNREIFEDGSGRFQSLLKLDIVDQSGFDNFYQAALYFTYTDPSQPGFLFLEFIDIEGIANLTGDGAYKSENAIFSDETFKDQATTIELLCHLPNSWEEPANIQEYEIVNMVLVSISANKDYAGYFEKLDIQANNAGGIDLFPSEAVVVPNNIENGYGIVAGYTTSSDTIPQ